MRYGIDMYLILGDYNNFLLQVFMESVYRFRFIRLDLSMYGSRLIRGSVITRMEVSPDFIDIYKGL